ncbi:LysR family transcriptional regulator [Variovorax sp. J22G21]|uniref:LysR family transcriptional regulator n=1 Tax=Variovorax fucosicus TaxID=3053517 RepID=UPI002575F8B4|nr:MULTISPECIES: LysR family transcriptional regulator [unclassified Variovorax]MDM0040025.1 LysR family transcriptional regulator [Variovorax sp. J22R193]MDM0061398.1 LysR family transcriptional regulator [Variovorax sp. J22G21]
MELKDIDLNLLVVFNQLLIERKVSKVAENLGLGQPAVSNALARLRKLFGDELFLRTSSGMQPTPFADQLAESIGYALGMIHGAVNARSSFDPASSKRSFSIGMTDIGEIYFLPQLMRRMHEIAPEVSISTVRNTAVNLKDAMEAGHVDLAIGLLPQLKGGFFQRRLFVQQYMCMFRKGHALDKKRLLKSDFFAADHVAVVSAGTGHGQVDEILDNSSPQRRVKLKVPHFVAIGHILQSTDLIATVPERLAERMAKPFDLRYLPHPVKLPQISINIFWHAKYHKDPANQWLRSLIVELHADQGAAV